MDAAKRRRMLYVPGDPDALAALCEEQARQGWLLEKLGLFLTFRRMEPKDLTFGAVCFPEAEPYGHKPAPPQQSCFDRCREAGWQMAASNGPLTLFYTRRPAPEPIGSNAQTRLAAVRRLMRPRVLPALGLALLDFVALTLTVDQLRFEPLRYFSDLPLMLVHLLLLVGVLSALVLFIDGRIWLRQCRRAVEQEQSWPPARRLQGRLALVEAVGLLMFLLAWIWSACAAGTPLQALGPLGIFVLPLVLTEVLAWLAARRGKAFDPSGPVLNLVLIVLMLTGVFLYGDAADAGRRSAMTTAFLPKTCTPTRCP